MRLPKDLVAASATPLVLSLLQAGDSYGYELIKSIRDLSGGELEWKEGMLYPLLHRLTDKGLIEGYDKKAATGRTRKYYRILPDGVHHLQEQRASFDAVSAILGTLNSQTANDSGGSHV